MITTFTAGLNGKSSAVFVDTGAWIALLSQKDELHLRAVRWSRLLRVRRRSLITTSAVVIEVLDGLAGRQKRFLSGQFRLLLAAPDVAMIHVDELLLERAWQFFEARPDQNWSLTDCLSFVAMGERNLSEALAHDHHFAQAGFAPLLRDDAP